MSFQQWPITTLEQDVNSIGETPIGKSISELCSDDSDWQTEECGNGDKFLYNQTLTTEEVEIDFSADGVKVGTILVSGVRPSCE